MGLPEIKKSFYFILCTNHSEPRSEKTLFQRVFYEGALMQAGSVFPLEYIDIGLGFLLDNSMLFRVERLLLSSFSRVQNVLNALHYLRGHHGLYSNDFIIIFKNSARKIMIVKVVLH